jgi:hypothetical protein
MKDGIFLYRYTHTIYIYRYIDIYIYWHTSIRIRACYFCGRMTGDNADACISLFVCI